MKRYFIEVAYDGAAYAGFQVQENANSIQAEIERALQIFFRQSFALTGSSRTDAGVHARQNFFHLDTDAFEHDEAAKRSYTRWGQPYEAALARGHDHGSAAYIADQWEAKHIHLTGGTGIIRNAADAAKRR